jgi:uncharacterized membrane protein
MRSSNVLIILLILLTTPMVVARDLRADPVTGRVRVIYMGKIEGSPFPVLSQEPLLFSTAVYACTFTQRLDTIRRSVRNYMPRTYSKFLENDVVVLCDANKGAFRTDHFRWMKDGVLEDGQGLVMVGGAESFHGAPSWRPTEVADILPAEMLESDLIYSGGTIRVVDQDDEFIKSLPFDRLGAYGMFHSSNNIQPRSRANLIAMLAKSMGTSPFLMWWDIGNGRTMAQSAGWQPAAGNVFMRWDYYGDYAINMMLFLAGQKLPEDLEMVYLVRRRMRETNEDLNMLYSMIEMVEKFGGSGFGLNQMVSEVQDQKQKALDLYVQARLDESLEALSVALEMGENTMGEAVRVRNAAAFWIFLTEWAVVTGTFLFTGTVLWTLMIKRRLYREVEITRLRPGG